MGNHRIPGKHPYAIFAISAIIVLALCLAFIFNFNAFFNNPAEPVQDSGTIQLLSASLGNYFIVFLALFIVVLFIILLLIASHKHKK